MKVSGRQMLEAFCREHAHARHWIEQWLSDIDGMSWTSPHELQAKYRSALVLGNRALFEIAHGNCMEVLVAYRTGALCVRWVGSRESYERRADRVQ